MNSNFKTFKNVFKLFYWIEGIITKMWALVLLDLDKRVKSNEGLKIRDYSINKVFTTRSLAENNRKRKRLKGERSLIWSKQWMFVV